MTASMPQPSSTMKIRAERSALADALGWVARAIPKNPQYPIFGGVRVCASDNVVSFSAFDYENQHTAATEATVGDEGECIVPGLFLRDAIAGGRGAEVELILDGPQLEIASGRSTYRARCLDAVDAPTLPSFPAVHGVVNADRLRDAVSLVAPAISDDPLFPEVQGVHIEGDEQTMTLVATDRFRFHVIEMPWNGDQPFEATVPGRALVEAVKGMTENDDIEVGISAGLLGLSDGRRQWTSRRFDRPYANSRWRSVIEHAVGKCGNRLSTDRADALAAVKQVASMLEPEKPIVLAFEGDELAVATPQQEKGAGVEVLAAEGETAVAIATNPRFLADALSVVSGPMEIRYGGSYERGNAFVIADTSRPELKLIVQSKSMPGGTK